MRLLAVLLALGGLPPARAAAPEEPNAANPKAVQEVLAGTRADANAAWWGFDPEDATEALQAAIKSGARRVVVPNMTRDWVVRPIQLAGNQELVFEEGVVIAAKRGEYRGRGDSVFRATDLANLTIRGYGATVRMQKEDYIVGKVLQDFKWNRWFGQYEKAEWRMPLVIAGSSNVRVLGVTLRDSGGDGIMVSGTGKQRYSGNIHIRDVVCDNNYRQGISIISADGLLVENSVFKNTWGTPPSSGVDIEPDSPEERVRNVVFRNCRFEDNYGDGIEIFLANLKKAKSGDVSILFDNCRVASSRGAGIRVTKIGDDGPGGLIKFRNTVVENTEGYGIKVQDKSAAGARVVFTGCVVRNARRNRLYAAAWAPIWFQLPSDQLTKRLGGVDFINCVLEDGHDRPAVLAEGASGEFFLVDVKGDIQVRSPFGAKTALKMKQEAVSLVVKEAAETNAK